MKQMCSNCKNLDLPAGGSPCNSCLHFNKWELLEPLPQAEGVKLDEGKLRYDLYPPEALEGAVGILTFGAGKYGDRNWEQGMRWGRVFRALMSHMWAWWRGESLDPETGKSHLHHAACCIAFLQTYEARGIGQDDRPSSNKKD